MDKDNIPVSMPDLSGNEESYVVQAIRSTWISSSGKFVQCFEREFARMAEQYMRRFPTASQWPALVYLRSYPRWNRLVLRFAFSIR